MLLIDKNKSISVYSMKLFSLVQFLPSIRWFSSKRQVRMESTLKKIFLKAVDSVKPNVLITTNQLIKLKTENGKEFLEINNSDITERIESTNKRLSLVGFGKAVFGIAVEIERALGTRLSSGIISVPVGALELFGRNSIVSTNIEIYEGAKNNLPDEDAMETAKKIKIMVEKLTEDDILFVLISGGGSALLPLPISPITLQEKSSLIKKLANSGASIDEINTVRIAISELKGGKLAELGKNAHKTISLVISDVVNDPLDIIASGPTYAGFIRETNAVDVLRKYKIIEELPESISKTIKCFEVPKHQTFNSLIYIIGNNDIAIKTAIEEAKKHNLCPIYLSSAVQGNVEEVSEFYFKLAMQIKRFIAKEISENEFKDSTVHVLSKLSVKTDFLHNLLEILKSPRSENNLCIVAGGETTVNVTGKGLGGRNQELALRFSKLCLESKAAELWFLSAGTDGIDGPTTAAGAIGSASLDPKQTQSMREAIVNNDSFNFYQQHSLDQHIICGHTNTNVMDVHLLIIQNLPEFIGIVNTSKK